MSATTSEGTGLGSAQEIYVRNGLVRTENLVEKNVTYEKLSQQVQDLLMTHVVYGSFVSTATQTNINTPNPNPMYLDTVITSYKTSIDGSKIYVENNGVFNIMFSAQIDKTDSGTDEIEIWINRNGQLVPQSNTKLYIVGNNAQSVAAWNWMIPLSSGQYVEIMWYSNDPNMRLHYEGAANTPSRPAIPSLIVTIEKVG